MQTKHFSRGFNLVEAAIVLGVIGLVIGGIWVAASQASTAMKANRTVDAIMFVANRMKSVLDNSSVRPAVSQANFAPQMVYNIVGPLDGYAYTPAQGYTAPEKFGTQVVSVSNFSVTVLSGVFTVNISEVPKDICLRIASRIRGIMQADPAGNLISGVTFNNGGTYAGTYLVPTHYVLGVFRFDTTICQTDRSSMNIAFSVNTR